MISKMFRGLFMFAAVSLAGLSGCAESPEPAPETANEVQSATLDEDLAAEPADEVSTLGTGGRGDQCCSYGYYQCNTTGEIFDYEARPCSAGPSSWSARRTCDLACEETCTNSGWLDPCR